MTHIAPMFIALFGLFIGSFLNVCIFRIPEGTFWQKTRSFCRSCGKSIPFYRNIPVLSYLIQRGRCAECKASISWQYPVVELLTAALFLLFYWKFPFLILDEQASTYIYHPDQLLRFAHAVIFGCFLIIATFVDLRLMIIPDVISLGLVVLTPLVVYFHPELKWQHALIGIVLGGGLLYLVAWLYWLLKKQIGMGMGDVKLLAGIGGWLGFQAIGPVVLYAAVAGSLVGIVMIVIKRGNLKMALPFGPFLAGAAILYLWTGPELLTYLHFNFGN